MQFPSRTLSSILLGVVFASTFMIAGCSARVTTGYRVHDGYYNDDHVWDRDEVTFYGRWENETHRKHQDFKRRKEDDQKEYWTWRHNQH